MTEKVETSRFVPEIGDFGKTIRPVKIAEAIVAALVILSFFLPWARKGGKFIFGVQVISLNNISAFLSLILLWSGVIILRSFLKPRRMGWTFRAFLAAFNTVLASSGTFLIGRGIAGDFLPGQFSLQIGWIAGFSGCLTLAGYYLVDLCVSLRRIREVAKVYPSKDQVVTGLYRHIGLLVCMAGAGLLLSIAGFAAYDAFPPGNSSLALSILILLSLCASLGFLTVVFFAPAALIFLAGLGLRRRELWACWLHLILCPIGIVMGVVHFVYEWRNGWGVFGGLGALVCAFVIFDLVYWERRLFPARWGRLKCAECGRHFAIRLRRCLTCRSQMHLERDSMPYIDCHHCGDEKGVEYPLCQSCGE